MSGSQYMVISAVIIAVLGVSPILPAVTDAEPVYDLPRLTPRPVSVAGIDERQVSLNGTWRFNPSPPEEFWKGDAPVGNGWAEIEVPGEWVMQGFAVEEDTAAGYRREFVPPSDWKGHRVKLRCDAVYSDAVVWVNGGEAGRHEGGFTPFELDVTDLVRVGRTNTIALAVRNESLSDVLASATQYAAHQLGGITRKIYLFAVPEVHIASLHVETTFDESYRDAILRVLLETANEGKRDVEHAQVTFELRACGEHSASVSLGTRTLFDIKAGETARSVFELPVAAPKKWDAEHPNLYVLACTLEAGANTLQAVNQRFGFRQVEVRGNEVFVNNRSIKLRGVCRHEVHPLRGRSLTPELWKKDAELYRNANINYIRTSHYPPGEEFIEACDELGLFVEEEAPLCWLGHGANPVWREWDCSDAKYLVPIVRSTTEMIGRDRSHPSVIIWSLANESKWGPNFEKSYQAATAADPTRPISFHDQAWGNYNNLGSNLSIGNFHYQGPGGPEIAERSDRPILFGEYCHLNTYNRREIVTDPGVRDAWGQSFSAMWEKMFACKGCLGGAIWSGVDDVFHLPSGESVGYGEWGPIDGWRRTKPEYWHVKKVYSPIRVLTKTVPTPLDGEPISLRVENRHDFTNLDEVRIEWALADESGTVKADIPPRSIGTIAIRPETNSLSGKALSLKFISRRDFLIDAYLLPVGSSQVVAGKGETRAAGEVNLEKTGDTLTVRGDRFMYVFDRETGRIRNAEVDNEPVLLGGPMLMILPLAATRTAPAHRADIPPLNYVCHDWKATKVSARRTSEGARIVVKGTYKEAAGVFIMKIDFNGRMTVDYRFKSLGKVNPRQIGVVFAVPGTCDTLAWNRDPQWTVYPQDHIGRPNGIAKAFQKGADVRTDLRTEPSRPWELDANALGSNDFRSSKANFRRASLTDEHGAGIRVISDGTRTARAFVDGDFIKILVAEYSNGGGEPFLKGHLDAGRRPLERGSVLKGTATLELLAPGTCIEGSEKFM